MSENEEGQKGTVDVELADPTQAPSDGPFESLIKVRIIGTERYACQMVKEAVLLGIEKALGDQDNLSLDSAPLY
jgi:hypothetical protein